MDESEKRRERLKVMRMEASGAGGYGSIGNSPLSQPLLNPLAEDFATPTVQADSYATPRFDYYTDPMSAFSTNKRRSKDSNPNPQNYCTPPGPRNPEMTFSPAHPGQINYSPDQGRYQARGPYHSPGPHGSFAMGMVSSFGTYQGTPGVCNGPTEFSLAPRVPYNNSPDQAMHQVRGPYHHSTYGSPTGMVTHHRTPGVWNRSPGPSAYYSQPISPGVGNFASPQFGQGGSPNLNSGSGPGRGCHFSNSPSCDSGYGGSPAPNSGRGRGRSSGNNTRPVFGRGSNTGCHAERRPDLYYHKSMVEDPWKLLKPVIWKRVNITQKSWKTMESLKSSLPKSVGVKKPRISEASGESSSQPSLAEYLAAAFNEASNA